MLFHILGTAQAGDGSDGQAHAGLVDLLAHGHDFRTVLTLAHQLQNVITAGLQTHVDQGQALFPERPKLLIGADADAGGRTVSRHTLALGKQLLDIVQDHIQVRSSAHQRIAVCQKHLVDIAVGAACNAEVLQNLLHGAEGKPLLLEHIAERTGVIAAAVSHLHNEAVGLRRGTEYSAVISHTPNTSKAAIFRQTHSTAMACSSSSTGGREGAMRMLLSCGSLP